MQFVAQDVREHMASLGFRTADEMIGRTDRLRQRNTAHWKAGQVVLSCILHKPEKDSTVGTRHLIDQDHGLDNTLDLQALMDICEPALTERKPVRAHLPIRNINRVTGTIVGSELTRRFG